MPITVPGASLDVRTFGAGDPVLLVHGFPFSSAMWVPVAERLARSGFRALAPDLRGFGGSAGEPASGVTTYADDLVGVLDGLGARGAVPWVGFSMGGYVALEAWRRHAPRIGALALVDTRATPDDDEARAGRLATAAKVAKDGSVVVADAMLPKLFAPAAPEALRRATHAAMAAAPSAGVAAALHAMASRADSTATLPTIRVPTLVLVGKDDAITPVRDAEAMASAVAGATLVVVEGAGHLAPLEQPDAVAEHLVRWLRRATQATAS
jgi:pimeloyl-ACP methyl ester carboxylesterase